MNKSSKIEKVLQETFNSLVQEYWADKKDRVWVPKYKMHGIVVQTSFVSSSFRDIKFFDVRLDNGKILKNLWADEIELPLEFQKNTTNKTALKERQYSIDTLKNRLRIFKDKLATHNKQKLNKTEKNFKAWEKRKKELEYQIAHLIDMIKPIRITEETSEDKTEIAFEALNETLLDLRNAQSKLLMNIGADLQTLYKVDIDNITKQIKEAEAAIETLVRKMHTQLGK